MRTLAAAHRRLHLVAGIGMAAAQRPRGVVRSQLVWVDRTGQEARDGRRTGRHGQPGAVARQQAGRRRRPQRNHGTRDLWLYDMATGGRHAARRNVADENWLIWSPDGRRVAFNSQRTRGLRFVSDIASRERAPGPAGCR